MNKECLICGKVFIFYPSTKAKYCSRSCYLAKPIMPMKKCLSCKKEFKPNWSGRKFCSLKCSGLYKKGKVRIMPDGWREKWEANKGGAIKGREKSEDHKKKISLAHIGRKSPWTSKRNKENIREKAPFWQGGISKINSKIRGSKEFRNWRKLVIDRDGGICFKCGKVGNVADHIKPFSLFPKFRFDLNNGQTLCKKCHTIKNSEDMKKIWEAFKN